MWHKINLNYLLLFKSYVSSLVSCLSARCSQWRKMGTIPAGDSSCCSGTPVLGWAETSFGCVSFLQLQTEPLCRAWICTWV